MTEANQTSHEKQPPEAKEYPLDLLTVESLDIEAQGIAHRADGKVVFIEGALPFEQVTANVFRKKNSFEKATLTAIYRESSQRVQPACPHFGMHTGACGGCKMQHLHVGAQVAVKQRLADLSSDIPPMDKITPAGLKTHLEAEINKWGPVIKKAGIYAD